MMSNFQDRVNFVELWIIRSIEFYEVAKISWLYKAFPVDLSLSRDLLGPGAIHPFYRPSSLLMGLAIETLLKAIIISKEKIEQEQIPNNIGNHTLSELALQAGIVLTDKERLLCESLTNAVVWTSKYPAPKKASALSGVNLARNNNEFIEFDEFYEKLVIHLGKDKFSAVKKHYL